MGLLRVVGGTAAALAIVAGCSDAGSREATVDDVWQLVDGARDDLDSADRDDGEAVAAEMTTLLAETDPDVIVEFADPLERLLVRSYRTDLWAAAYVINGGASDDGFDYFRGWLVSQGRTVYDRALADPDSLARLPAVIATCQVGDSLEAEGVLYVPSDAYMKATGKELPADAVTTGYPELTFDFDFEDEAEMRHRLPRLTTLCYR